MPDETASANEGGVEGIFHVKSFPLLVIAAISVNVPQCRPQHVLQFLHQPYDP